MTAYLKMHTSYKLQHRNLPSDRCPGHMTQFWCIGHVRVIQAYKQCAITAHWMVVSTSMDLIFGDNSVKCFIDEFFCRGPWASPLPYAISVSPTHPFSTVGDRDFPVAVARLWNTLPQWLVTAQALHLH